MTNVLVPTVGESIKTVILSKWLVAPGQVVKKGAGIAEIDSDKASMEVPSPADGILSEQLAAAGDEIAVGAVIATISDNGAAEAPKAEAPKIADPPKAEAPKEAPKVADAAKPEAARPREERREVVGGPAARRRHAEAPPAATTREAPAKVEPERIERVPMTPLRRTVARRLVEAKQSTAMLTTFNEVDMGAVMALRKQYQDKFTEKHGIKLGFMSFFVKAAVAALKAYPAVNAEIQGNDILYKRYHNIGVAVSAPKGLVVPVLRDADALSFADTEKAIAELGRRARENKLVPADFEDGTFTITNGGVFGSLLSTPILNPPQVGILGMHNITDRPMARDGQVVIRPMMFVALSYDHRIIDGREAVGFLVRIKECVEAPDRMLLEV